MPLTSERHECVVTCLPFLVLGVSLLEDQSLTGGGSTTFGIQKMVKTSSLLRLFQAILSAFSMGLGSLFSLVILSLLLHPHDSVYISQGFLFFLLLAFVCSSQGSLVLVEVVVLCML